MSPDEAYVWHRCGRMVRSAAGGVGLWTTKRIHGSVPVLSYVDANIEISC